MMMENSCQRVDLHFLDLPDIVLEKTLSYLTYDEIARSRVVCRTFDNICKVLLNRGFLAAERFHAQCLKSVKAQLPKRESKRRTHPMSCHCEILSAVGTRLSLLSMTFTSYVDAKVCCFIPGKVIDEIFRVLHYVKSWKIPPQDVRSCSATPPKAHEMLREMLLELRDISSMAMEHFDESVAPKLKQTSVNNANRNLSVAAASNLGISTHTPVRSMALDKARLDYNRIQTRSKQNKKSVGNLKKMLRRLRLKVKTQGVHLTRQNRKLTELGQKLRKQDSVIAELQKHFQEWDHILGHQNSNLLSSIGTPVRGPPTPRETPQVAVPGTSASSPVQETSAETLAAEAEDSDTNKESNCDNRGDSCEGTSPSDEKGNASQSGSRCKRVPATKRKVKLEQSEDLSRSRYNPIMDAIRAKRVCLFLEELQG